MNANPPHPPRPLHHLSDAQRRVLTTSQLREHGVSPAAVAERCRAGGPWRRLLPGVHLLHPGPPTGEERLHAALLYTASRTEGPGFGDAMITGLAALALRRFSAVPALPAVDRVDVLVPRTQRLRSTGFVRFVSTQCPPRPEVVADLPTAPAARALADATARLADPTTVARLLTEAVRGGHCDAAAVVGELGRARLLSRPHVAGAIDTLVTEGRAVAEGRLYALVRAHGLPEPLWHVDLRLPGGPYLGGVDAYWPELGVALEIDTQVPHPGPAAGPAARPRGHAARQPRTARPAQRPSARPARPGPAHTHPVTDGPAHGGTGPGGTGPVRPEGSARPERPGSRSECLAKLGITVVRVTPKELREAPQRQAAEIIRALVAAADRGRAGHVHILPR
ncbi:hypothetical protein RKE29_11105 [Streptomyces sp. B1866]|uniref:hypothetical protein n=1 Tax=Streptomyces sp. B1866 TaxID=3075431 RepID=UPI00288D1894|nr:hypothetical protein [Streptomyces sp. B1866]MDT3397187.1 hypothetical protein [Streptomyces sp. B1866]